MERQTYWRHGLFGGVLLAAFVVVIVAAAMDEQHSVFASFGHDRVTLSGETASQARSVAPFESLTLRGGYDLKLTAGKAQSVTLTGDTALLDITETRVEDGDLVIGPDGNPNIGSYDEFEVRITVPTLRGLTVDGAVDGILEALDSERIEIVVNGAAQIEAEGRCGLLEVETNGAGKIDARSLECRRARVETNGAGSASVFASESVEVEINGVGTIDIYGNPPEMRTSKTGLGNITVHGRNEADAEKG